MAEKTMKFLIVAVMLVVGESLVLGDPGTGKIIEFGWGTPDPVYVREHIAAMQKIPFDGLVLDLPTNDKARRFGWQIWGPTVLKAEDYSVAIAALKATNFGRFTDNFLRLNTTPGGVDWFDENFASVIANAALAARVARQSGFAGLVFDTESYDTSAPFFYPTQTGAKQRSFAEYEAKVRARGREFMRAVNKEFPGVTILMTYAYYTAYQEVLPLRPLQTASYGLLPAFIDGMLDAADAKTRLIDGWEYSYEYRDENLFRKARDVVFDKSLKWTGNVKAYQQHYGIGFGLWVDSRNIWHTDNFSKNFYTPQEFAYSLHLALKHTDRYVWVYSQQAQWWKGNVPQPYMDALIQARQTKLDPPASLKQDRGFGLKKVATIRSARTYPGADDKSTFGSLWTTYSEIMTLPQKGWKFHTDLGDEGERQKWYSPEFNDRGWRDIEIAEWWEPQEVDYDGVAWYRGRVQVPSEAAGKKLFLTFGAVDESAWIYVNGHYVGEFNLGIYGWDKRFELDVTRYIKPGSSNSIVVKVLDSRYNGGIWKPVKLITPKVP